MSALMTSLCALGLPANAMPATSAIGFCRIFIHSMPILIGSITLENRFSVASIAPLPARSAGANLSMARPNGLREAKSPSQSSPASSRPSIPLVILPVPGKMLNSSLSARIPAVGPNLSSID